VPPLLQPFLVELVDQLATLPPAPPPGSVAVPPVASVVLHLVAHLPAPFLAARTLPLTRVIAATADASAKQVPPPHCPGPLPRWLSCFFCKPQGELGYLTHSRPLRSRIPRWEQPNLYLADQLPGFPWLTRSSFRTSLSW
jgi:hypothetical protein